MAEPLDTWHRHAKHNPQTLHTETADRIAQCTLWKHFIAGVGPRADHADTVELRPSRRASDSAFHGLQHRVRAELPCVHLINMDCYSHSDGPREPSGGHRASPWGVRRRLGGPRGSPSVGRTGAVVGLTLLLHSSHGGFGCEYLGF